MSSSRTRARILHFFLPFGFESCSLSVAMGSAVSKVRGAVFTRPLQRFNAEERAHKVLDREAGAGVGGKPTPAPKFPADQQRLQELRETDPQVQDGLLHRKDSSLDQRLKEVFVTSTDPAGFDPDSLRQPENPERPLPRRQDPVLRWKPTDHVFNDPGVRPRRGKATLTVLQDVLALHRSDPRRFSAEALAREHDLNPIDVENLLRHFRIFDIDKPDSARDAARRDDPLLAQPDWEEVPPPTPPGRTDKDK